MTARPEPSALVAALAAFRTADSLREMTHALRGFGRVDADALRAHCPYALNVGLAANYSTQYLARALPLALADRGVRAGVVEAPFGQWELSCLESGPFTRARVDVVVLSLSSCGLWHRDGREASDLAGRVASAVRQLREHSGAQVVVTFPEPLEEEADPSSWAGRWRSGIRSSLAAALDGSALLVDLDPLVREVGGPAWFAPRYWATAKFPFHPDRTPRVARYLAGALAGLVAAPVKLVVTDLDGTLWGGIVGEDGAGGVNLDADGSGHAHLRLQRYLLDLRERGVLLAVCSKNNPADARGVFRTRPEMILREEHFASFVAGWEPKPKMIRAILSELNLSTMGVAFLDDSPAEREEVRSFLPELWVPELPPDAAEWSGWLARSGRFTAQVTTREDRDRSSMVAAERDREAIRAQYASREEYLASLNIQVTSEPVGSENLERVVQLISKTNQFNLRSIRHSRTIVAQMAAAPSTYARAFSVADRFGPYGLTGVLIAQPSAEDEAAYEIDTWLLSCRVMGRDIERRMLADLRTWLLERRAGRLVGEYHPTDKNGPVRDLLPAAGFEPLGANRWVLRLP